MSEKPFITLTPAEAELTRKLIGWFLETRRGHHPASLTEEDEQDLVDLDDVLAEKGDQR